MKTDQSEEVVALQPESEIEQSLLKELFTRLTALTDAPPHPSKVGDELVYYTLDVTEYDDLDHDLFEDADCSVNEHGQLDPDPGSRALVVTYGPAEEEDVEEVQSTGGHPTEQQIDEAVEAVAEADDGGNEYNTVDPVEVAAEIRELQPLDGEDVDYNDDLQRLAQDASKTDYDDIPANQTAAEIIGALIQYAEVVEEEVEVYEE